MHSMASPITSLTVVYSTVYSDANQRKHQSSASLDASRCWKCGANPRRIPTDCRRGVPSGWLSFHLMPVLSIVLWSSEKYPFPQLLNWVSLLRYLCTSRLLRENFHDRCGSLEISFKDISIFNLRDQRKLVTALSHPPPHKRSRQHAKNMKNVNLIILK